MSSLLLRTSKCLRQRPPIIVDSLCCAAAAAGSIIIGKGPLGHKKHNRIAFDVQGASTAAASRRTPRGTRVQQAHQHQHRHQVRHFSDFFKNIQRPTYHTEPPPERDPVKEQKKIEIEAVEIWHQAEGKANAMLSASEDEVEARKMSDSNIPPGDLKAVPSDAAAAELYLQARTSVEKVETLLDVFKYHEVEGIEAACDGIAACSTCHCYLHPDDFKRFPPPEDHELDMLELAANPVEGRSRLACQVDLRDYDVDGAGTGASRRGGKNVQKQAARKDIIKLRVIVPQESNNLMDFIPFEDPK
mmetsp:Transcript_18632/g.46514  ORF Transcript_18632/g.46514 Transcript_18632/m.46514 type:complete len:302 (-) Transcript_18632:250-1155(-)